MAYFETDGGRRVKYEHYRGAGTPVVLVHGWGMAGKVWVSVIEGLIREGHEVVVIDQRGCGRSDRDFADVSVSANAGDVVAIVGALGLRPAVINGWSLGGAIAVEAAHRLGASAAGLMLTCGATPRLTSAADFPYGAEPGSYAGLGEALLADRAGFFAGIAQGTCARDMGPATVAWLHAMFMDGAPMLYTSLAAVETLDQRTLLGKLAVPVLSIVGGKDAIVSPDVGRQVLAFARNARIAEFADCGHAPFLEEPAAYLAVLLDFVAECDRDLPGGRQ